MIDEVNYNCLSIYFIAYKPVILVETTTHVKINTQLDGQRL